MSLGVIAPVTVIPEYGTAGTQIFTEYIWLLPETSDGAQTFGGDDGTGGWTPLAVVTAPGNTTQTLLYLRSSHLGVPVGSTNATGTNTAIATGTTLLGFPGQQQTLADLYYNQYRDYDTVTGRYIQADPLGLDGDINPYAYAGGNPVRFRDPLGLECIILFTQRNFVRAAQRQCDLIDRPDTLNVFGHGGPNYICRGLGRVSRGECMDAVQFRDTYRTPERQARIRNITFWGCNTGRTDDGLAQRTANYWHVPVRAPDLWTWWGEGYSGVADVQRTWFEWLRDIFGEVHGFPPHHTGPRGAAGEWRVFQPQ